MTKITGIPRVIGMTGDWDAKRTSMTGLTGITTIMDKSPWESNAIFISFCHFWVPSQNGASFLKCSCSSSPLPYKKLKL